MFFINSLKTSYIFWSYLPLAQLLPDLLLPPYLPNFMVCVFSLMPLNLIYVLQILLVWGLPQRMVDPPKALPFKKTDSPSPSIYQMSVTSEPWMDFVSQAMRGFCVSYTGLEQAAMSSYMELPSYALQTLFAIVSHHLWLLQGVWCRCPI